MEPCGQPNGPLSSQIDNDVHFLGWLNMATRPSPGNLLHSSTAILRRNCLVSIHLCVKLMCEVKKWNEVAQSYLTLCNPMDCSPPGCSVHGILQARILEWVAISFSRGSSWPRDWTQVFRIRGRHFNLWSTREAPLNLNVAINGTNTHPITQLKAWVSLLSLTTDISTSSKPHQLFFCNSSL